MSDGSARSEHAALRFFTSDLWRVGKHWGTHPSRLLAARLSRFRLTSHQLVRRSKLPRAARPRAQIWSASSVSSVASTTSKGIPVAINTMASTGVPWVSARWLPPTRHGLSDSRGELRSARSRWSCHTWPPDEVVSAAVVRHIEEVA